MGHLEQRTPEIGSQSVAPGPSAAGADNELIDALTRHRRGLLARAARLIRWLKVDEADLDAEGAVDLAFSMLCNTEVQGGDCAAGEKKDLLTRA